MNDLMRLNKQALVKIIEKLKEENRLLRKEIIYTCMECGTEFNDEQVEIRDNFGNVICPICMSGNVSKE